jgi:hypothetical protein
VAVDVVGVAFWARLAWSAAPAFVPQLGSFLRPSPARSERFVYGAYTLERRLRRALVLGFSATSSVAIVVLVLKLIFLGHT